MTPGCGKPVCLADSGYASIGFDSGVLATFLNVLVKRGAFAPVCLGWSGGPMEHCQMDCTWGLATQHTLQARDLFIQSEVWVLSLAWALQRGLKSCVYTIAGGHATVTCLFLGISVDQAGLYWGGGLSSGLTRYPNHLTGAVHLAGVT